MAEFVSSKQEILDLIKASYPLIYIVSAEEDRVEKHLKTISTDRNRALVAWSTTEGFTMPEPDDKFAGKASVPSDVKDPFKALEHIEKHEGDAIFVLRDFHPYLTDPFIVRKLRDLCKKLPKTSSAGKKHIILLSSVFKAPVEIEKDIAVVDFDLPDENIVTKIFDDFVHSLSRGDAKMREIARQYGEETDEGQKKREIIVKSALGLTANEISSVLMKSVIREKDINIDTILSEKKNIIRKSGILEFYQTHEQFSDIGGLEILKDWLKKRRLAFLDGAK
ncbi:MAG: ATPase, partial [Deltaproteobacteria bacterium]|nr:ATPase [Deltaproteobacteria bacterium]